MPSPTPTAEEVAASRLSRIIPWFQNPPDSIHSQAAETITSIWLRDANLGLDVASLSSITDGVSEYELASLDMISTTIKTHLEAIKATFGFGIAQRDLRLAILIAGTDWFADGVVSDDPYGSAESAIRSITRIAERSQELSRLVSKWPWIVDDMTSDESLALQGISNSAEIDVAFAITVAGFPWVVDGVTADESQVIEDLRALASLDLNTAEQVSKWMTEGISDGILSAISFLLKTASTELLPVRQAMDIAINSEHGDILHSLSDMADTAPGGLIKLANQSWFADGLNEEERAYVIILADVAWRAPELYEVLLQTHFAQSKTIALPLAGPVKIWAFQTIPFPPGDHIAGMVEQAVRVLEEFTGVPFPTKNIITLVLVRGSSYDYRLDFGGKYLEGHVVLTRSEPNQSVNRDTVYHEIAHYYLNGRPTWLSEGGADFIKSYVNRRSGRERLEDQREGLSSFVQTNCVEHIGVNNLQQLSDFHRDFYSEFNLIHRCNYNLGEFFLMNILDTIGEEATGAAIGELHLTFRREGPTLSEEEIYRVFLRNTPVGLEEKLLELYRRIHGGLFLAQMPYQVPVVSIPDSVSKDIASSIPWADSPPDAHHIRALKAIVDLWQVDRELGAAVSKSGWLIDGVSRIEAAAASDISEITDADLELGELVSGYPWVVDGIRYWEHRALESLLRLIRGDRNLGRLLASFPWMADDLTFRERLVLDALAPLGESEPDVAKSILDLSWVADDLDMKELQGLIFLGRIALKDMEIDRLLALHYKWVTDGLSFDESYNSLRYLALVIEADGELAKDVLALPWVADGMDQIEQRAIYHLYTIARSDNGLGRQLIALSWFVDGIDGNDVSRLESLIH